MCFCYLTKLGAKFLYPMPKFFKGINICRLVKHICCTLQADLENAEALRLATAADITSFGCQGSILSTQNSWQQID
jgi:hypothetical protein